MSIEDHISDYTASIKKFTSKVFLSGLLVYSSITPAYAIEYKSNTQKENSDTITIERNHEWNYKFRKGLQHKITYKINDPKRHGVIKMETSETKQPHGILGVGVLHGRENTIHKIYLSPCKPETSYVSLQEKNEEIAVTPAYKKPGTTTKKSTHRTTSRAKSKIPVTHHPALPLVPSQQYPTQPKTGYESTKREITPETKKVTPEPSGLERRIRAQALPETTRTTPQLHPPKISYKNDHKNLKRFGITIAAGAVIYGIVKAFPSDKERGLRGGQTDTSPIDPIR